MKKIFSTALLAATFAIPMAVQAQNLYVGTNLVRSELKESTAGKESNTGFKLYGGYNINQTFGVELGYVGLGEVSDSEVSDGFRWNYSVKPRAIYVAATGTLPLSNGFSVFGKAGISDNSTKVRVSVSNGTDTWSESDTYGETTMMLGIGAAYSIASNMSVVAEYENFGKIAKYEGGNLKADALSIGLRYQF